MQEGCAWKAPGKDIVNETGIRRGGTALYGEKAALDITREAV